MLSRSECRLERSWSKRGINSVFVLVHAQLGLVERDGGVRFSIGAFNSAEEVDAATAAIADIAQWAWERKPKSRGALAHA
jgi:cysteine sulfinate desulfinase/cysteine desulfurase-like protein